MIVAIADNGAIGVKGDLPWHLSADLKYFKRTTHGYPVIMGRTTFESIGRPLPGRTNIVLTSRPLEGVICVASLAEAFCAAAPADKCFVIGGASVYSAAIGDMDRIYVTEVHTRVAGADAFFPPIPPDRWRETSRSGVFTDETSGLKFEFVEYAKR